MLFGPQDSGSAKTDAATSGSDAESVDTASLAPDASPDASAPDALPPMDATVVDAGGPSGIGTACMGGGGGGLSQGTCASGQLCIPDQFGFPNGYCTENCTTGGSCPSDATCVDSGMGLSVCLLACQRPSDCRAPDYDCQMGVCIPNTGGPSLPPGTNNGMACVMPIETAPGTGSLFGASMKVSEATQVDAAECEIAVDPTTHHVVIAYNDFSNTFSKIGVAVSDDDGQSFRPPVLLPLDTMVDANNAQSDPVPINDGRGHFYVSWVGLNSGPMGPTNMNIFVAKSSDGGHSFTLSNVSRASNGQFDKPWIAASPHDGSLIVTWLDTMSGDLQLAHSSTGATWSTPIAVNDGRNAARNLAQPIFMQDGRSVVTFFEFGPMQQQFGSTDNTIFVQRFDANHAKVGTNVQASTPGDSPGFDDPSIAVFGNNVYVGYISGNPMGAWDVRVATSTDGGAHFSPSVKVNDDPTCATHFHHQIVVDSTGRVHAIWYDNRYLTGNVFHAVSPAATAQAPLHFGASTFVNDAPFTFTTRRDQLTWLGDYLGVQIVGSWIYAAWTDNRSTGVGQIFFARGMVH
jgi:hypothetical protein